MAPDIFIRETNRSHNVHCFAVCTTSTYKFAIIKVGTWAIGFPEKKLKKDQGLFSKHKTKRVNVLWANHFILIHTNLSTKIRSCIGQTEIYFQIAMVFVLFKVCLTLVSAFSFQFLCTSF